MDWRQLARLFPSQGKIFTKKAKKQDENKDIIKNKILTLVSLHLTLDSRESWERGLFEFSSVTLTSKLEAMFHTHLKKFDSWPPSATVSSVCVGHICTDPFVPVSKFVSWDAPCVVLCSQNAYRWLVQIVKRPCFGVASCSTRNSDNESHLLYVNCIMTAST